MCEENLKHDDKDIVEGKIWLIGRSYSASPERRQGKSNKKNTSYNKQSDFLQEISKTIADDPDARKLDKEIESMRSTRYNFADNLKQDLTIIRKTIELVQLLNGIVKKASNKYNSDSKRKAENNVSFASKYLHFHLRDIVYLYDSISRENTQNHININYKDNDFKTFVNSFEDIYKVYTKHTLRCHCIAIELMKKGKDYSPRAVDDLLLGYKI